jgi:hypothetical protein
VRWRKVGTRILSIGVLLFVAYLLVANGFLRTRILRDGLSKDPEVMLVDYDTAYSIVPGRLHVEELTIRARESSVEWIVRLDRADVHLSLFDLLRRRFHATSIRADGLSFRARLRIDPAHTSPAVLAALPPIPGFADPPAVDVGPEAPPLSDAEYKLWSIDLEDVQIERVREVWVHTLRGQGESRVRARWFFRPQRWLDMGPATIEASAMELSYGTVPLATGVNGTLLATIHPFDVRQDKGLRFFNHVSVDGQLHGTSMTANILRSLELSKDVAFSRGTGPLDGRFVMDHGTVAPGTLVTSEAPDSEVDVVGLAGVAPFRAQLNVDGDLAMLSGGVSEVRVSRLGVEQARAASVAAAFTSRHRDIEHFFDDASFVINVGGVAVDDIGKWKHFLPSASTLDVRSAAVTGDGHAEGSVAERRGRGTLQAHAQDLSVSSGRYAVTADVAVDIQLPDVTLRDRRFEFDGSGVVVTHAVAKLDRANIRVRAVTLRAMRAEVRGSGNASAAATVAFDDIAVDAPGGVRVATVPSLTLSAPHFAFASSGLGGTVAIDLPRLDILALRGLRDIMSLPRSFDFEDGRGSARLHAAVDLGTGAARGECDLSVRGVRARVASTRLFGDLTASVHAQRSPAARETTDLSGSTFAIRRAGTGDAAPFDQGWWANAALRDATVRTRDGAQFDAKIHVDAKDATPATALVAANTAVPRWAADLFRMPVLDADGELPIAARLLQVRSLAAKGGGQSLRMEYANRGDRHEGAILIDAGAVEVAYDLTDGAKGLVLLGSERWFARKQAMLHVASDRAQANMQAAEQLGRYRMMTPPQRAEEAKALAAACSRDSHACDGASIENLLEASDAGGERGVLTGVTAAPMVVAAAKAGLDGTRLDPRIVGRVVETLRMGGSCALDSIPRVAAVTAAKDPAAARGKVIAVIGHLSSVQAEGSTSVGTLITGAETIYFVTPFSTEGLTGDTRAAFRGVFVQKYAPPGQPSSLIIVGAFGPAPPSNRSRP